MDNTNAVKFSTHSKSVLQNAISKPVLTRYPILKVSHPSESSSNNFTSTNFNSHITDPNQSQNQLSLLISSYNFNLLQKIQQLFKEDTSKIISEIGKNNYNNLEDGENVMDDNRNNYVTHHELDRELKHIDEKNEFRYSDLSHQIESSQKLVLSKIENTNNLIDAKLKDISSKIDGENELSKTRYNSINEKFASLRWFIAIVVSIISIAVGIWFH